MGEMFFGARGNSVDVRGRVPGKAGEMAAVRGHVFEERGKSVDVRGRVLGEPGETAAVFGHVLLEPDAAVDVRGHVFGERAKSVDVRGRVLGGARRDGRCFRACSKEAGTTRRRMNFTSQNV